MKAKAPTLLWVYVVVNAIALAVFLIVDPPRLLLALFEVGVVALLSVLLLRGSRVVWTLLVASGAIGLLLVPFESLAWWNIAVNFFSLLCLLAPPSRRFVWGIRSTCVPKQRQPQTAWAADGYSDQDRPDGWYLDPSAPGQMRYWHSEQGAWMGTTRTPRRVRRQLNRSDG